MKKIMISLPDEMVEMLEKERQERYLQTIPETVRVILSDYLRTKVKKNNAKKCPKCPRGQRVMDGEFQEIPMRLPLPIPLNPTINLEPYTPQILQGYKYYAIFVCRTCGFVEFFVYNK